MNKGDQEDFDSDWAEDKDAMSNGAANRGALDCFFLTPYPHHIEIVPDLIFKELV